MAVGDVTGIDSVVLLRDGVDLQRAVLQQPQPENDVTQRLEELSPTVFRTPFERTTWLDHLNLSQVEDI